MKRPAGAALPLRRQKSLYAGYGKRLFDLGFVILSAPVAVPLIALLMLYVAWRSGTPFYRQLRVGRGGRPFRLLKLRTMVQDADDTLASYLDENPAARREWNLTQKLKHDPRIIPGGQFLRRSSLDELPQLWNVLRGEMSLIGPRPMMVSQRSLYPGEAYYSLRPGITGLWQVSDRNNSSFAARAAYDTRYWSELSFKADLAILARTAVVVLRCTGY
ncbi:sugar transferase (plasmid) [Roseobacteraceae bacterium NS-SX3]